MNKKNMFLHIPLQSKSLSTQWEVGGETAYLSFNDCEIEILGKHGSG